MSRLAEEWKGSRKGEPEKDKDSGGGRKPWIVYMRGF